jgi:hypothetical protein
MNQVDSESIGDLKSSHIVSHMIQRQNISHYDRTKHHSPEDQKSQAARERMNQEDSEEGLHEKTGRRRAQNLRQSCP